MPDTDTDDLRGQFVISRGGADNCRSDWRSARHSGWVLQMHHSLPVRNVFDATGMHVGWLLGYAIDTQTQRMITNDFHLGCDATVESSTLEAEIYSLAGRYALLLLGPGVNRIYVDPCGSLSVLFSKEDQIAGSTAQACKLTEPIEPSLAANVEQTRKTSGTWYPCGLTQWRTLKVLIPNHYLDLETWTLTRHWPSRDHPPPSKATDTKPIVKEICRRLASNIAAVVAEHQTTMQLTAGRDTRMLLACSRTVADKVQFETSPTHSATDVSVASTMAKLLRLQHRVNEPIELTSAVLQGVAGEVGRAFYWRRSDVENTTLTGVELAKRMGFPDQRFAPHLQNWLDSVAHLNSFLILDLLYIVVREECRST